MNFWFCSEAERTRSTRERRTVRAGALVLMIRRLARPSLTTPPAPPAAPPARRGPPGTALAFQDVIAPGRQWEHGAARQLGGEGDDDEVGLHLPRTADGLRAEVAVGRSTAVLRSSWCDCSFDPAQRMALAIARGRCHGQRQRDVRIEHSQLPTDTDSRHVVRLSSSFSASPWQSAFPNQ